MNRKRLMTTSEVRQLNLIAFKQLLATGCSYRLADGILFTYPAKQNSSYNYCWLQYVSLAGMRY